jgi:5S rRNA maturation endonuclease (ribonuclease M5)
VFGRNNNGSLSWKIKCKDNNSPGQEWIRFVDYAENSLSDFFKTSRIITTSSNNNLTIHNKLNKIARPNEITIEDIDVDFRGDEIRVEFTKKYQKVGKTKDDENVTKKVSIIDYKSGKPQLLIENVVLN